jgi:RNA polymerase sigma-70 factor, ECF subfamily
MKVESRATPLEDVPDRPLVERVLRERADDAFRALYRRHTPLLYRVALRSSEQPADAEDLVQECWSRAMSGLAAFRWQSSLRTWLTGILINLVRESYARRGHRLEVTLNEEPMPVYSEDHTIDLERAVALLSPGARAVFLLHDVEGFTHREIAEQLGCTAGTSKTQLHRARHALRRALGAHHEEG